jgi:hypothetical protein
MDVTVKLDDESVQLKLVGPWGIANKLVRAVF